MHTKKICYFVNTDWYFNLHWLERALAVKKEGFQVAVISNFRDLNIFRTLQSYGFDVYHVNLSEHSINPFLFISTFIKVSKLLNIIKPDLIHCITIKPSLIGGLLSLYRKYAVVIGFAGLGRVYQSNTVPLKIIKKISLLLYSFIVKNPKCILCFEHEYDRSNFLSLMPTKKHKIKTEVIEGAGINLLDFPFTKEIKHDFVTVLFASRLLWSKGLGDLIEAKKKLSQRGIFFHLYVAGISVPYDKDSIPLSYIKEWEAKGDIIWLGQRDDIARLIKDSNIVALPTRYSEGIPRILLEAGSIGRPCISYNVDGCRSLIINNETGILVDNGDIEGFAEGLKKLITNHSIRVDFGKRARARIEDKFSSQYVINRTIKIYKKLVF